MILSCSEINLHSDLSNTLQVPHGGSTVLQEILNCSLHEFFKCQVSINSFLFQKC